jgi:hypothetical protein
MNIKNKAFLGLICLASFAVAIALPTVLLLQKATAQSSEVCYFITPSGSRIDLSKLCGVSTPSLPNSSSNPLSNSSPNSDPNSSTNSTSNSASNVVQVKIKRPSKSAPISRLGGSTPVLEIVFNNKPYEMFLSTEIGTTVITQKMAREIGVVPKGTIDIIDYDGSAVKFPAGYVDSISIGGRVINNVKVGISPVEYVSVGSLGYDILGKNYGARIKPDVVEFYPRG